MDLKQGEFFGADVVAGHQPDATEYALVTGYHLEPVACFAPVARIHHEACDTIEARCTIEFRLHVGDPASCHTAPAFDAAISLIDGLGEIIVHWLFPGIGVEGLLLVNPRPDALVHGSEPGAGIHG